MPNGRPLRIPVILDASSKGGASAHAARFVHRELRKREGVRTELIYTGEPGFIADLAEADAIVIVGPEDEGGLDRYAHRASGVVAVSAGRFGGARVIETSLAVLRELGLVTLFWDVNVGIAGNPFEQHGRPVEDAVVRGTDKFLVELIRMARVPAESPRLALAGSAGPGQDRA